MPLLSIDNLTIAFGAEKLLDGASFQLDAGGLEGLGDVLADYHDAAIRLAHAATPDAMRAMERLQHELEARDGWRWQQRVETVISRLQLPADTPLAELSGGWRRRVLLGRSAALAAFS